jgi:hypothetical protein
MHRRTKGGGGNAHQRAVAGQPANQKDMPSPVRDGREQPPSTAAKIALVSGLVLGLLPWGLGLIGVTVNLPLGALILFVAFSLGVYAFWIWEHSSQWHVILRVLTVSLAAIVYFGLVGMQIHREYKTEHVQTADIASKPNDPPTTKEKPPEQPAPEKPPQPTPKQPKLYAADVVISLILPYYWGVYQTGTGETVTPIDVILSLRIVNLQDRLASIIAFLVEAKTPHEWIVLHRIPLSNVTLYDGTPPLSSVRRLEFQPSDIGPDLHVKELAPGQTVRGIALYDWSHEEHPQIQAIRITIFDSAHNKAVIYPASNPPPTMTPQDPYSSLDELRLAVTGPIVDLSSLPVMRYSVRTGGK